MNCSISIIIPVYNVEKYIYRCISSILNQTFSDFELLLIDDGSTDNSLAVCEEFAKKDYRVHVFHKENGGVSSARNVGLDHAKGKYVTFIDSDDYIGSSWLSSFMENNDEDLIIQGYTLCNNGNESFVKLDSSAYDATNLDQALVKLECMPMSPIRIPWNKLFKRELIDKGNCRFEKNMSLGEDFLFNINYLDNCKTIRMIDNIDYYYQVLPTGLNKKKYSLSQLYDWNMRIIRATEEYSAIQKNCVFQKIMKSRIYPFLTELLFRYDTDYHIRKHYIDNLRDEKGYCKIIKKSVFAVLSLKFLIYNRYLDSMCKCSFFFWRVKSKLFH